MRVLLDTHVILWAAKGTLDTRAREIIEDMANELLFSPVNLWEIEIKRDSLGVDARTMQQSLTGHGYTELPLTARHVIGLSQLPVLHKDPFDRMLLSQAAVEKVFLLTADSQIGRYSQFVDGIITFG